MMIRIRTSKPLPMTIATLLTLLSPPIEPVAAILAWARASRILLTGESSADASGYFGG